MKKFGFTLSELIVALGIIGVVTAVTAPMISSIIPDKDKVRVLKVYKVISDINSELLNSKGIYWTPAGSTCVGLACTQLTLTDDFKTGSTSDKYITLLARRLNTVNDYKTTSLANGSSFYTVDGMLWTVSNASGNGTITVDLDGASGNNCYYSDSCNKKPDKFVFNVDSNGRVTGGDPLTRAYLANPSKLNDRKKDLDTASKG